MDKLKDKLVGVLIFAAIVGFGVDKMEEMPDNAIVYADTRAKVYYGEPTALKEMSRGHNLTKTTLRKVFDRDYTVDERSKENGDFVGNDRSLISYCLVKIGLLPDVRRWNPDGTWNY